MLKSKHGTAPQQMVDQHKRQLFSYSLDRVGWLPLAAAFEEIFLGIFLHGQ